MRPRPVRGLWRAVVVASLVLFTAGWLAGCAGDRAASNPTSMSRPTIGPGETTVRVLQMNLCNSGRAECYSGGRAVSMAAALVNDHAPEMVSLNEVCRDDVEVLEQAMSTSFPAATIASAFKAAEDRPTRAPVRCQNGQEFGDAVLAVVPSRADDFRSYSGVYPDQDLNDPEERVWVCIHLATQFTACTTHTSSTSRSIALAQCRYMLSSAAPMVSRRDIGDPIILGADLNLAARGSPSPQSCLPRGYQSTDDGALQDVVVSSGIEPRSHSVIDMRGTTDHPALLVDVVLSRH
jgi:hypothetical protein